MNVSKENIFKKKSRKTVLKAEEFPCKQRSGGLEQQNHKQCKVTSESQE